MLTNSLRTNDTLGFDRTGRRPPQSAVLLDMNRRGRFDQLHVSDETDATVEISPSNTAKRRAAEWDGVAVEIVQVTRCERIEFRFSGSRHLLVVHEQGTRQDGETVVEGLSRSTLRDCRRKLTFVPAGREYYEWQEPRHLGRVIYFYFDPARFPVASGQGVEGGAFAPKLFFEDTALWDTALKLAAQIENSGSDNQPYLEALGVVLEHELVRLNQGAPRKEPPVRGGLAGWQQRIVTSYIEEHLAEPISLATLAQLVRLSTYYFCRAFKQSFGVPPHRYHTNRRIERAKALLANQRRR